MKLFVGVELGYFTYHVILQVSHQMKNLEELRQTFSVERQNKEILASYQENLHELGLTILSLTKLKTDTIGSELNEASKKQSKADDLEDEDSEIEEEEDSGSIASENSLSQKRNQIEVLGPDDLSEGDIARHVMSQVAKRLRGDGHKSLSDELDDLIDKATDKHRLSQMYEGWMAWI